MNNLLNIAKDEWRLWARTKLAIWSALFFFTMLFTVGTINVYKTHNEQQHRAGQQKNAEDTFLAQPDRHPHRMVHYGHYAFRTPSPLAVIDPGLDAVTGQSIFLEGHRQNSAAFNESAASADLGGLSWLSPALIYQWFGPLLIVLLGYGSVVRERESSTLSTVLLQGISGTQLLFGKFIALLLLILVLMVPMLLLSVVVEGIVIGTSLTLAYLVYLSIWSILTVLISALIKKRATILITMISIWLLTCLLIPSIAVDLQNHSFQHKGKIESDLQMLNELRKLGDGHNSNDPAFAQIRANLLAQYDVEKVEDLPVNLRGIVAQYAEEKLTAVLNKFGEERMVSEIKQASLLEQYGWVSPALAIAKVSRSFAGTDLYHYHEFLKQTEELRFNFVQGLNKVQAEQMDYQDDMNRSSDKEAEKRTRMSADNWQLLESYQFKTASFDTRIDNAKPSLMMLIIWLLILLFSITLTGRTLKP